MVLDRGWKKISGGLKHVSVSGDGRHVWGCKL